MWCVRIGRDRKRDVRSWIISHARVPPKAGEMAGSPEGQGEEGEGEEKKKAAESVTMARRIQKAEEGMTALLLELEAEEVAEKQAAGKKKQKEGKASGGKSKKKR